MITKLDKLKQAHSELKQRQQNCASLNELISECSELLAVIPTDTSDLAAINERRYIAQRKRDLTDLLKDETAACKWLSSGGDSVTDTAKDIATKLGL